MKTLIALLLCFTIQSFAQKPLKISKETTWFTEPLKKDGTVDYIKALNLKYNTITDPDKNIAYAFMAFINIKEIDKLPDELRKFYSPKATFFDDFRDLEMDSDDDLVEFLNSPWSKDDNVDLFNFFEEHNKSIDAALKLFHRPEYKLPIPEDMELLGIDFPYRYYIRTFAKIINIRSNLYINNGLYDKAINDLSVIKKFGENYSDRPFYLEFIAGVWISRWSNDSIKNLLASKLKKKDLEKVLELLKPSLDKDYLSAESAVNGERAKDLDFLSRCAKDPIYFLETITFSNEVSAKRIKRFVSISDIDWNEVAKAINRHHDLILSAENTLKQQEIDIKRDEIFSKSNKRFLEFHKKYKLDNSNLLSYVGVRFNSDFVVDIFYRHLFFNSINPIIRAKETKIESHLLYLATLSRLYQLEYKKAPRQFSDLSKLKHDLPINPYTEKAYKFNLIESHFTFLADGIKADKKSKENQIELKLKINPASP